MPLLNLKNEVDRAKQRKLLDGMDVVDGCLEIEVNGSVVRLSERQSFIFIKRIASLSDTHPYRNGYRHYWYILAENDPL